MNLTLSFTPLAIPVAVGLALVLLIFRETAKIRFKRRYHEVFAIFLLDFAAILALTIPARMVDDPESYLSLVRLQGIFVIPLPALLYHFTLSFVSPRPRRIAKYALITAYMIVLLFLAVFSLDFRLFLTGAQRTPYGFIATSGPVEPFLISYELFFWVLSFILLFRHYLVRQSAVVKNQALYLLVGLLVVISGNWVRGAVRFLGVPVDAVSVAGLLGPVGCGVILLGFRRHGFAAIAPVAETRSPAPMKYRLREGSSYVSLESDASGSFVVLTDLIQHDHLGLCMTRSFPDAIREAYELKSTPIRWLTEAKSEYAIAPQDLLGLSLTVVNFLQNAARPVVLLHGLEYLVSINGFKPILRLIQRLNDVNAQRRGIILIPLVPGSLSESDQALLTAECIPLQTATASSASS